MDKIDNSYKDTRDLQIGGSVCYDSLTNAEHICTLTALPNAEARLKLNSPIMRFLFRSFK